MKVCIIGLGYMGLPTAFLLAKGGHKVDGYDILQEKICSLNRGELPFEEIGLYELFEGARKNFRAISSINSEYDIFVICVPTPFTEKNLCDLSYINSAAKTIKPFLRKNSLIVLESTGPLGVTIDFLKSILEDSGLCAGTDFGLATVCEKAIPGNTIYEMIYNARIIGGINSQSRQKAKKLYKSFVEGEIITTDCTTAEAVKLAENTYRDINIALANELAKICSKAKIDVWQVIELANKHPRVNIHQPGPGVGGHCIPVDPWFLIEKFHSQLIKESRKVNDEMPINVCNFITKIAKNHNTIGVLGVAYKKNIDDARNSPALKIIQLLKKSYQLKVHDPYVKSFEYPISKLDAVLESEVIVVITDHDIYRMINFPKKSKVIDTRNMGIPNSYLLGRDF